MIGRSLVTFVCFILCCWLSVPAARAFGYDDIVTLVQAEEKVFGRADYSKSLDQRLRLLENKVLGSAQSGSDSVRLHRLCRSLGLPQSEGPAITAPYAVKLAPAEEAAEPGTGAGKALSAQSASANRAANEPALSNPARSARAGADRTAIARAAHLPAVKNNESALTIFKPSVDVIPSSSEIKTAEAVPVSPSAPATEAAQQRIDSQAPAPVVSAQPAGTAKDAFSFAFLPFAAIFLSVLGTSAGLVIFWQRSQSEADIPFAHRSVKDKATFALKSFRHNNESKTESQTVENKTESLFDIQTAQAPVLDEFNIQPDESGVQAGLFDLAVPESRPTSFDMQAATGTVSVPAAFDRQAADIQSFAPLEFDCGPSAPEPELNNLCREAEFSGLSESTEAAENAPESDRAESAPDQDWTCEVYKEFCAGPEGSEPASLDRAVSEFLLECTESHEQTSAEFDKVESFPAFEPEVLPVILSLEEWASRDAQNLLFDPQACLPANSASGDVFDASACCASVTAADPAASPEPVQEDFSGELSFDPDPCPDSYRALAQLIIDSALQDGCRFS